MAIKSSKKTRSPKKQTSTRPSQRKGTVLKTVPKEAKALLKKLHKENDGVKEMRRYPNGSIGVFFTNGKFRFVTGGNNLKPREKGSKVTYPRISKLAAKRALLKYYNNKSYKSPANRKSALTRDLCSNNKPINKTSLYRRSPHLYTYPGIDDGSQCPNGGKVYQKKKITRSVKKTLLKRLKGKTATRKKGAKKSPKLSPRRKSKVTGKRTQKGGTLNDNDISEIMEEYQNKLEGVDIQTGGVMESDEDGMGMFVDHSMDIDHGMEGGDMDSMDMDMEMEADHGMEGGGMFNYNMKGGFLGLFSSNEGKAPLDAPIASDGDGVESIEPPPGLDNSAEQIPSDLLKGEEPVAHLPTGILKESGPESITEEGVVVGGEESVAHLPANLMEGGDLSHMGINQEDSSHMNGGSNYSESGANLTGITGGVNLNNNELSMDSDDESSSDDESQLGGMIPRQHSSPARMTEVVSPVAVPVAEHPLDVAPRTPYPTPGPAATTAPRGQPSEDSGSGSSSEDDSSDDEGQLGGGSDLSLNDAVGLLREYYTEKYGH